MTSVLYFSFDTEEGEQVEVQMGVSFVSIENARLNLDREQAGKNFEQIHAEARSKWNDDLSRITVEGGTDAQKTVFYTALYHLLIHPNILQDVNGEYPAMESDKILTTKGDSLYCLFSLGYLPQCSSIVDFGLSGTSDGNGTYHARYVS